MEFILNPALPVVAAGAVISGGPILFGGSGKGYWFTPSQLGGRRHFKQGEVMPEVKSDYGLTIWQWDEASQEPSPS